MKVQDSEKSMTKILATTNESSGLWKIYDQNFSHDKWTTKIL